MITSYEKMPLGIYKEMLKIATNGKTDEENAVEYVALLAGMTEEEVLNLPITEFQALTAQLGFLYERPKPTKPKKRYLFGEYDCEVQLKPERLTAAQYIDFKELASKADELPEVLLSVFLVPHGKQYNNGYCPEDLHRVILDHLPITDAQAILAFFLKSLRSSISSTLIYSAWLMKAAEMALKGEKREQMIAKREEMMEAIRSYESGAGDTLFTFSLTLPTLLGARSMPTR